MKTRIEPVVSRHSGLDSVCFFIALLGLVVFGITGCLVRLFRRLREAGKAVEWLADAVLVFGILAVVILLLIIL